MYTYFPSLLDFLGCLPVYRCMLYFVHVESSTSIICVKINILLFLFVLFGREYVPYFCEVPFFILISLFCMYRIVEIIFPFLCTFLTSLLVMNANHYRIQGYHVTPDRVLLLLHDFNYKFLIFQNIPAII